MATLSFKVTKKARTYNEWSLKGTGLTCGMLMAMQNALQTYVEQTGSPVAYDVRTVFDRELASNTDFKEFVKVG